MKAAVIREHGSTKDISIEAAWPDPSTVDGHVQIRVESCSLNYHDLFTLQGMPGISLPFPLIMGIDVAGTIESVPSLESGWSVGDRVLVDPRDLEHGKLVGETTNGGLAELCRVHESQLIRIPDDVTFDAAAVLPVAYGTAYRMMVTRGQIQRNEKVLILGASGGVGTCCVQIAKMNGAEVIVAASSDSKLNRLHELGADDGIDYSKSRIDKEIFSRFGKPNRRGGGGVDVVVNFTGGSTWVPSLRCLTKGGRMLTCGATAGYDPKTDIRYIWTFEQSIIGSNGWERDDLHSLIELVRCGTLRPIIDRSISLAEVPRALEDLQNRKIFGKIIVKPGM